MTIDEIEREFNDWIGADRSVKDIIWLFAHHPEILDEVRRKAALERRAYELSL